MLQNMTEGAPLKLIIPFMVPLLIGNIFQQLYNIADIIIVGRTIGCRGSGIAAVHAYDGADDWSQQRLYRCYRPALRCAGYAGNAPQHCYLRCIEFIFRFAHYGNYAFGYRPDAGDDEYSAGADGGCICLCNDYCRRLAGDDGL